MPHAPALFVLSARRPASRRPRCSARWWVAVCAAAVVSAGASARQLTNDVRALVDKRRLGGAKIGVVIAEADSGRTLAALNADTALIPASNMKALTSAAAVAALGKDFVFETTLSRDGDRLIVRGSGDPGLGDPELLKETQLGVEDILGAWVEAVRKSGGQAPTELVIDDRVFDRQYTHPTWPKDQLHRWYCAQVAGLNFHTNILSVFARPTQPGRLAAVTMEPRADWIELQNKAVTKGDGSNKLGANPRPGDPNAFVVSGEVRFASEEPVDVCFDDPPMFFARLFADRLKAAGLGPAKVRLAESQEMLGAGRTLAVIRTPMEVALRRCNVNSYNLYAEALMKRMGRELTGQPGSWENGAAALRMQIQERLGPQDAASVSIADGSGMSRENRVSAATLARWLASFHSDAEVGQAFIASLPEAGKDGTLKNRFKSKKLRLEVRAKTGYIRSVSSLSGYVSDMSGGSGQPRRLVFSILVNDWPPGAPLSEVRAFQNDVVWLAHDWLLSEGGARAQQGGN